MKKLKFRYDNKLIEMQESSHAGLFRTFFDWWIKKDIEKAIFGTFGSGLRISEKELFEGNVIKKKNLKVADDLYIITHITPQAMDKGIFNFLEAVDADIIEPKPQPKTDNSKPTPTANNVTEISLDDTNTKDEADEKDNNTANDDIPENIAIISALAAANGIKNDKNITMAQLVKQRMAQRDKEIKAKLSQGNRK